MRFLLGLAGAAFLLAGLIVGFALPVNSADYDCGSAFHENGSLHRDVQTATAMGGDGANACDERRSSARRLPVVLLVFGAVAGAGAVFAPRVPAGADGPRGSA